MRSVQNERLELKLFQLHFAVVFELSHVCFEVIGRSVCSECLSVVPCFAEHKNVAARTAFKNVVRDAAFVLLASCCERESCLECSFVLAFVGLIETVDTNHKIRFETAHNTSQGSDAALLNAYAERLKN